MPIVSVVIPTHNRLATLRRTLRGYLGHACRSPFELLVVDDGSSDGTWDHLRTEAGRDTRLRPFRLSHGGPARARNRAIAEASGDLLLLAGDDVRPAEGLIDGHVAAHQVASPPRFVLGRTDWDPEQPITPVMRHVAGFGGQQFRYAYLRDGERLGFRYFYGSNLSLRRETVASLDEPFDPSFGGAAFEDTDLGYRLMGAAPAIDYRSRLLAYHDHAHTLASFAERQRRAGLAAEVLVRKHPRTAPLLGIRTVDAAIAEARAGRSRRPPAAQSEVAEAESRLMEALAPVAERGGPALDRVGLGLFWYWYARGVSGWRVAAEQQAATASALWRQALRCPLAWLISSDLVGLETAARLAALGSRLDRSGHASRSRLACLLWRLEIRLRERKFRRMGHVHPSCPV